MTLRGLVERLEATDISQLDVGGVASGLRDLARLKGFVADTEHALARRANELAAAGSGAPAGEVIGRSTNCSHGEAERTSRRAEALSDFPSMSAQLGRGRISTEHADAIAVAMNRVDAADRATLVALDDELARYAASSTPARFRRYVTRLLDQLTADRGLERAERQRAATSLSKGINHETGMYWLRAELDPESGSRLFRAIDGETTALAKHTTSDGSSGSTDRSRLAAQALVELATSASRSRRPGRVELLALIDLETLIEGSNVATEGSVCELGDGTEMPIETIRRLACEAHVIPVVLNGEGVALDVGRTQRLATDDQRRALRAMYRTCGIGNCDVPFDRCEIHHLDEWGALQGETNLDRLIPGCSRHHHLVHEGKWRLDLDPSTRELTITLPDGTLHSRSRPRSAAATTVRPAA